MHQSENGQAAQYTTIEDIAAHYLSEIRTVQPKGPYFIGGYCIGGLISLEMAQQLKKQNEEVALLAVLEPSPLRTCRQSAFPTFESQPVFNHGHAKCRAPRTKFNCARTSREAALHLGQSKRKVQGERDVDHRACQ